MERRLTTLLAADIVGYSALMDHDRTGTIATLKSFREETFRHSKPGLGNRKPGAFKAARGRNNAVRERTVGIRAKQRR